MIAESSEKPPENGDSGTLKDLDERLARARESAVPGGWLRRRMGTAPDSALGLAFRVAVELVSALAVGLGIGWLLDQGLGTRPWLMLVFILLGGVAGILNVYRMASGFGYAAGYRTDKDKEREQEGQGEDRRE